MKKILYIFALGIGLFTSCKKGTLVENTVYEKLEPTNSKYSYLKLLNASPGSPLINFYINGTKFSSVYTSLGIENGGFGYDGLFPNLGYAITAPGSQTLTASTLTTATVDPTLQVFSSLISPEGGKNYSIFTTGSYDVTSKKIPSSILLNDVRPATDTTKIFVRFVNLYNGGPNVDMKQTIDAQTIASGVAFGKTSDWVTIPNPGQSNKYSFFNSGTGVAFPATLTVALTKGRAYTVYVYGLAGSATYPLKVDYYTTFY